VLEKEGVVRGVGGNEYGQGILDLEVRSIETSTLKLLFVVLEVCRALAVACTL